MPTTIRERQDFLIAPAIYVSDIPPGVTTPDISNRTVVKLSNGSPLSLTYFDNGANGQTIRVLGDSFTVAVHSTILKVNSGVSKVLMANKIYTFTLIDGVWYEAE